jgi:hypothetical protein
MLERAGSGVQQVVNRFATWLDVDGDNGEGDLDDEDFDS